MGMDEGTLGPTLPCLGLFHRLLGPQRRPQHRRRNHHYVPLSAFIPPASTCSANTHAPAPLAWARAPTALCTRSLAVAGNRPDERAPSPDVRLRREESAGGAGLGRRARARPRPAPSARSGGNSARALLPRATAVRRWWPASSGALQVWRGSPGHPCQSPSRNRRGESPMSGSFKSRSKSS